MEFDVQPQHEVFYIQSMLYLTTSILTQGHQLADTMSSIEIEEDFNKIPPENILFPAQTIVMNAAALARYFWPVRKNELHVKRAKFLKEKIGINDDSVLNTKAIRDCIEHFDERLDKFLNSTLAFQVYPQFVGCLDNGVENFQHFFRAYDPNTTEFLVMGNSCYLQPILNEVGKINMLLLEFNDSGRFALKEK